MDEFRVVDHGEVSGLRSQTIWHAIAEAMQPGDPPVLALQRPGEPYVSIGYHRSIDEVDLAACALRGLPVFRRRVGGGPVYCDEDQLFFQVIVPAERAPAIVQQAWQMFLAPAVEAFVRLGADAYLGAGNDIRVGDQKVSGLGAARIGNASVFVGNVIMEFDYDAMVDVLALPDHRFVTEVDRLMRRYLTPITRLVGGDLYDEARRSLIEAYAGALGLPRLSGLSPAERRVLARTDRLFQDPSWVWADRTTGRTAVKIRSGVGVFDVDGAVVSVVDGRIDRVILGDGWVTAPGGRADLERTLSGLPLDEPTLRDVLSGSPGAARLAGAIVEAHRRGL